MIVNCFVELIQLESHKDLRVNIFHESPTGRRCCIHLILMLADITTLPNYKRNGKPNPLMILIEI